MIAFAAALTALALGQSAAGTPVWSSVQTCLEHQASCADGRCAPALERACRYDALDERAAAVVRAETRALAAVAGRARTSCAAAFPDRTNAAARAIGQDGPLTLSEPYAPTPGAGELDSAVDRELFWRAQLDERLTGLASAGVATGGENGCGLSPFAEVVQLRAQNLAYAESVGALELARRGQLSAPALWGVWFIYNHADLWQDEQAEAATVFTDLARDGVFAPALAQRLQARVADHGPLYTVEQLDGGWPDGRGD
ncbi:hypothetical protein ACWCOP_14185 [Maricaulaceae bacterium MS644]